MPGISCWRAAERGWAAAFALQLRKRCSLPLFRAKHTPARYGLARDGRWRDHRTDHRIVSAPSVAPQLSPPLGLDTCAGIARRSRHCVSRERTGARARRSHFIWRTAPSVARALSQISRRGRPIRRGRLCPQHVDSARHAKARAINRPGRRCQHRSDVLHSAQYFLRRFCSDRRLVGRSVAKDRLLAAGYAIAGTMSLAIILLPAAIWMLAIVFIAGGIYIAMEETLEDSLCAELVDKSHHGMAFGVLSTVNGLGDFVSSIVVGALGPRLERRSLSLTVHFCFSPVPSWFRASKPALHLHSDEEQSGNRHAYLILVRGSNTTTAMQRHRGVSVRRRNSCVCPTVGSAHFNWSSARPIVRKNASQRGSS